MGVNILNIPFKFLMFMVSFFYMFLGTLYSIDFFKMYVLFFFGALLLLNFIFIIRSFFLNKIMIERKIIVILFFFSFVSMIFSCFYNISFELFFGVLNFLFLFLFFSLNFTDYKLYQFFDISTKSLFVFITCLNFLNGFDIPFKGVFYNPNSLGGFYATISLICGGVFLDKYKDIGKTDYFILIIIILSLIFSLFSNSRISFILSTFCFFCIIFIRFGKILDVFNKKIYFNHKRFLTILFIFFTIIFFIKLNFQYISDIFLNKFFYKLDNDDFSAGRSDVWISILDNMSLFGYARNSSHLESFGLSAHNTFMSILDQFGYVSALLFILGCGICLFVYVKISIIKRYGYLPFLIVIGFVLMSISESMINKTIMFCLLMILNLKSYQPLERK